MFFFVLSIALIDIQLPAGVDSLANQQRLRNILFSVIEDLSPLVNLYGNTLYNQQLSQNDHFSRSRPSHGNKLSLAALK